MYTMKILNRLLGVAVVAVLVSACQRDEITVPVAEVTTDKTIYKVKDSVRFQFSEDADMITFYSGEKGKEYKHRNRLELEGGDIRLNIETQVLYGLQTNNLKLMVSTDFNGKYTKEDVETASWTDVSSRLTWCVAAAGAVGVRTVSEYASIKDLVKPGLPLYFGFKYTGLKSTSTVAQQRTWRVYQFNVQNKFSETEAIPVTNRANAGWNSVTTTASAKGLWFFTNADMIYYNPESNLEEVERWAISKRFDPNKVAPDNGLSIKKYPDNRMKSYAYTFSKPGTYEVTFVLVNGNYKDVKETVKTVQVIVE